MQRCAQEPSFCIDDGHGIDHDELFNEFRRLCRSLLAELHQLLGCGSRFGRIDQILEIGQLRNTAKPSRQCLLYRTQLIGLAAYNNPHIAFYLRFYCIARAQIVYI